MNLVRLISTVLSDPAIRAIALPLIEDVIDWVRSGKPTPAWLDVASQQIPELRSPLALQRAALRARSARAGG